MRYPLTPTHPGQRRRAIWYCLLFGLLPWWCYERRCHYAPHSYRRHRWLNLALAARWWRDTQRADDVDFEQRVNNNW